MSVSPEIVWAFLTAVGGVLLLFERRMAKVETLLKVLASRCLGGRVCTDEGGE